MSYPEQAVRPSRKIETISHRPFEALRTGVYMTAEQRAFALDKLERCQRYRRKMAKRRGR